MDTTDYRLPDGRIVAVDSTAAKGAAVIGFTLVGGQVVDAVRVAPTEYEIERARMLRLAEACEKQIAELVITMRG